MYRGSEPRGRPEPVTMARQGRSMNKVTVLYTRIDDRQGFEDHFYGSHLPAAMATPGLVDIRVSKFQADQDGPPPVQIMVELLFRSEEELKDGMASDVQAAAVADFGQMLETYGLEVQFLTGTEDVFS